MEQSGLFLSDSIQVKQVDAVLLLDGLHTDYITSGKTLHQGGKLNADKLNPFLQFANAAMKDEKKMLITHSSLFPGTYASTTEWQIGRNDEIPLGRECFA